MYEINVPPEVKTSSDVLIGDIEKFFELLETGYYFEQWTRLNNIALKGIHQELSSEGSTAYVEAVDPDTWLILGSAPLRRDGNSE